MLRDSHFPHNTFVCLSPRLSKTRQEAEGAVLSSTSSHWDDVLSLLSYTQHQTPDPNHSLFFICPCSESTLLPHVTPTAPTLLLRLENSPALSFIFHCSQPNKIGSRGKWEGESLGDETGWLYLNQQQTLKSYTELVFSRSSLTRVIRVNTVKEGWDVGEICLCVLT